MTYDLDDQVLDECSSL